jgi:hypothetical protein
MFGKLWKGIRIGIRTVDQVASTPVLGQMLSSVPVLNSALVVVHGVNALIPHPQSEAERRAAAIIALRAEHPGYDDETLGKIYDATAFLKSVASSSPVTKAQAGQL